MSAAAASGASVDTASENRPGLNVSATLRAYASGSATETGTLECSTEQYENPASGVMWTVEYSSPHRPFME